MAYDRLLVATGSKPFIVPVPGHDLPGVIGFRDLHDVETNFDGITYAKGASVLKQLVAYVGRDAFRDGIRIRLFVEATLMT